MEITNEIITEKVKEEIKKGARIYIQETAKAAIELIENAIDEIGSESQYESLKKENEELKEKLSRSVEFPHIEISPWGDTVIYYLNDGKIYTEIYTRAQNKAAEVRLKELGV